jgi:hypothetical protein
VNYPVPVVKRLVVALYYHRIRGQVCIVGKTGTKTLFYIARNVNSRDRNAARMLGCVSGRKIAARSLRSDVIEAVEGYELQDEMVNSILETSCW